MSAKKSRKDNIPAPAAQPAAPAEHTEKSPVSAAPRQDCCGEGVFSRKDTLMVVLYSVLLLFAMTVQTGTVSMILCALAFLSLLGKKPLLRFRQRLCVPVLGLLAFAIIYGAAAIYSPFGASGLKEFYKFLAAFSLVVILLARFDRRHVPGLLWGFGAVSAVITVISVDISCARVLFGPFNGAVKLLGGDFSSVLDIADSSVRVSGIYSDANVLAFLCALGALLSLYLLLRSACWKKRLAAALLAEINLLGVMTSGSRGALLCLGAAGPVWLLAEKKGRRIPLGLLLAASAMVSLLGGAVSSNLIANRSESVLAVFLLCGVLLWSFCQYPAPHLAGCAERHPKILAGGVGGIVLLAAVYLIAALNIHGAFTFRGEPYLLVPAPSAEAGTYTLSGQWQGQSLTVRVYSPDDGTIYYYDPIEYCTYMLPEGVKNVSFLFFGAEGDTLESVEVTSGTETVPLTLNYPLLPRTLSARFVSDAFSSGESLSGRWAYDLDALKLFAQAPVFGHGLGSTENLYRSVQSFQYESKYTHNHLLQTMSDTGAVGTAFALCFVLGAAWLCLWARKREGDGLAAALLAVWVMMNLHSLMEINFSVRGTKCAAYVLLALPLLLWAECSAGETVKARKRAKTAGTVVAVLYALYLAAFGGLLESARLTDSRAADFQTSDVYEYLDFLRNCVRGDVFDHDFYQRNYVANAVQLNDPSYNGDMLTYVAALRASGTYENCSALARYYYLPREKWDDLFACSLEGIRQVRSSPDGWNLQMDFYREEVLPAMGADNMDQFLSGVLELGDALDAMNAEGRQETVSLNEENQSFLSLCRSVSEQGLSGTEAYTVLSMLAGSAGADGEA